MRNFNITVVLFAAWGWCLTTPLAAQNLAMLLDAPNNEQGAYDAYYAHNLNHNDQKTSSVVINNNTQCESCGQSDCGGTCCESACLDYCDPCCDSGCGDCACGSHFCTGNCGPFNQYYRFFAFGDYLALRARNVEVAYGSAINGPIVPGAAGIQTAPIAVTDQHYDPGFRAGFGIGLGGNASITAQYTFFETEDRDFVEAAPGNVLRSLVSHPETNSAASTFLEGRAFSALRLDLVDVDYRNWFFIGEKYSMCWLAGTRYANLEQQFSSVFSILGTETVNSNINFDGAGIRVGMEAERIGALGITIYGKGHASFVAGEFRGSYVQTSSFDPVQVYTNWKGSRVVSMLDMEIGTGWTSANRHWRFHVGYLISGWFNTVKTDDFIRSVQRNNWLDLNDTITFDGAVSHVEYRF